MIYQFNNIAVDLQQFELRANNEPVLVEPKVFDLIVYLIKHRHRVVSRDELFQEVWQGRTVSDTSLSNHIKSARKALGDNGNLQCVIKTIRSRGYQFIAQVSELPQAQNPAPASTINEIPAPEKSAQSTHSKVETAPLTTKVKQQHNSTSNKRFSHRILGVLFVIAALVVVAFLNSLSKYETPPYLLVVPFSVSSQQAEKWEPFADQITRELIQSLRKVSGIKLVPPPSSFTFKGNKVRSHIKQQLPEVNYVLDGIVREDSKGNIRITVELENLEHNTLLWDGDFDVELNATNRFVMQSEIAASVSKSLQLVIGDPQKQHFAQAPTQNVLAYDYYVQGQHQLSKMTHQSVLSAIEHFSQAIALDPTFEAPYIAKANAYRVIMTLFDEPKTVLPKVISSAIDLLEINPESSKIKSLLGLAYVHTWQWQEALSMLKKAQAKEPNNALTQLGFTLYYAAMGDETKVKIHLAIADNVDPLNEEIAEWGMWALMMTNQLDAAIKWGEKKIKLHPKKPYPLLSMSVARYMKGELKQSIGLAERGVNLAQGQPFPLILLAQAYAAANQENKARELIARADAINSYTCPYEIAVVHTFLGDKDAAFSSLNQALHAQSNCLIFTRNDPRLESLRGDVRFNDILKKLKLDQQSIAVSSRESVE